jgi:hypothetical protein
MNPLESWSGGSKSFVRESAAIVFASLFLSASIADLHSQNKPPPNMVVGSKPDNSLYYWHPPKTNHFRMTNVWITIAGEAMTPGSEDGTNNEARFNQPVGLAMDEEGDLYVTDVRTARNRSSPPWRELQGGAVLQMAPTAPPGSTNQRA